MTSGARRSTADLRRHPVGALIRDSAYWGRRGLPTAADLEALNLDASTCRAVAEACAEVAAIHDTGHHSEAWAAGDRAAAAIIDALPGEQRDPGYLKPPDPLAAIDDPDELAAHVQPIYAVFTDDPED